MYVHSHVLRVTKKSTSCMACHSKNIPWYGVPGISYSYDIPGTPEYLVSYIHVSWLC